MNGRYRCNNGPTASGAALTWALVPRLARTTACPGILNPKRPNLARPCAQVDLRAEAVLVPIYGVAVPFHILNHKPYKP